MKQIGTIFFFATIIAFSLSISAIEVQPRSWDRELLSTESGNCTDSLCNYNGRCNDEKTECVCDKGYITFESSDGTQCNYQQKNTLTAFLLEFFLGAEAGAGYFYIGQTGMAVGQLLLFWVGLVPLCLILCCGVVSSEKLDSGCVGITFAVFGCLYVVGWFVGILAWWIYALVTIGQGSVHDGNGAPIPQL